MQSLNTKEKLIEKQNKCHIEHIKRKEIELSVKENFLIQETERYNKYFIFQFQIVLYFIFFFQGCKKSVIVTENLNTI